MSDFLSEKHIDRLEEFFDEMSNTYENGLGVDFKEAGKLFVSAFIVAKEDSSIREWKNH